MADAKRQTEIIDALNQAIAANIQAIVDEGGKAGEGSTSWDGPSSPR